MKRHRIAASLLAAWLVAAAPPPIVGTASGPVQGMVADGVSRFLGIPYAAPPLGPLRWRPPAPPAPWSQPRLATRFGPTCAQITEFAVYAGPANSNENCLTLNVFTPPDGAGKPVLLWIHGGGLIDGESDDYDATALAKAGPSVIVTINYRLGLFGYLAHPALDAEDHPFGNYGLLDQIAALRWIHDNIAGFGGDPAAVTVGGQSAGSISAAALMLAPAARGLFRAAIMQSGAFLAAAPRPVAEDRGARFAAAAGCPTDATPAAAACLRALPADAVVKLSGTQAAAGPFVSLMLIDGDLLPEQPGAAFAEGHFNPVPVMLGSVRDEGGFAASINETFNGPLTSAQYEAKLRASYASPPGAADQVLAAYPFAGTPSYIAVLGDPSACRTRHLDHLLADKIPLYAYQFDDRTAPWYFPPLSFSPGAAHTIDIQYLFTGYHGGPQGIVHKLNPAQARLSAELVGAWTNFMRTGNPNRTGDRPWPAYRSANQTMLSENLGKPSLITDESFAAQHNCGLWDGIQVY